jgi:nucleoside-diphosphate-sugar epimerase
MNNISVYGSTGFIGSKYCSIFSNHIAIPREQNEPETNNILYLVSTIHNYNVFDDIKMDVETNLVKLLDVLGQCRAKYDTDFTFNFISSWFVYGQTNDLPAKETSDCNPKGFYSITKRAAEQLIISYCETFGIKYRILRLCNVYGDYDNKSSKKRNALQHLIEEVVKGNDINLYDRGENIRDFLHIEDVCRAIDTCVNSDKTANSIVNIGSGKATKFIDVMNYVKSKTNSPSNFNFVDPPHFHKVVQVQDMYLDVSTLRSLGFVESTDIYSGVDKLINTITEDLQ